MASFTDWLARNFFVSEEQEQTSAEVAAAQQAILDRQRDEGRLDPLRYLSMTEEVRNTGTVFFDQELGHRGLRGLLGTVPWWVWPLLVAGLVIYFWPVLRPFANRLLQRHER